MSHDSLRAALRAHTSDLHQRLDNMVGPLSSVESYRSFVARSYAFRSAVEPALQPLPEWSPQRLADALRADMDDLGCGQVSAPSFDAAPNRSANLGCLYVLEGSSMGARLLYNAARKLGFTETHGARHLALQTGDTGRWKQFSALLDTAEGIDGGEALSGARALFAFAIAVYSAEAD